jgi:hypothetical protein
MTFQEKNKMVTLVSFTLILLFFLIRVFQMLQNDNFIPENIFRLWGTIIVLAIVATILGTILTHIVSTIIEAIITGNENPEVDDMEDERDKLIELRGTRVTHTVSSLGGGIAMLTYVLGQSPLVMFTLLIFFGLVAQIIGDISRLRLYRRGF